MPRLAVPGLAVRPVGLVNIVAETTLSGETMRSADPSVERTMYGVTQPAPLWWLALVVDVLAAARITRLLVKDVLPPVKNAREALLKRFRGSGWAVIAVCAWCASFWVALAVFGVHVLLAYTAGPTGVAVYAMLLAPFAISHIIGVLSDLEGS